MAHVKSYSDLMVEGLQQAVRKWKLRLLIYSFAVSTLILGLLSASISILLWAALPLLNQQNSWVLIAFPATLLILSWIFFIVVKRIKIEPLFNDVQEQLTLDLAAICQAAS
jgi:hypothetical protein